MTDDELLALAATAVNGGAWHPLTHDTPTGKWNPLEDDGDALRLAVTLGIGIEAVERYAVANVRYGDTLCEAFGADPFAATRRAIVRAAAAIAPASSGAHRAESGPTTAPDAETIKR